MNNKPELDRCAVIEAVFWFAVIVLLAVVVATGGCRLRGAHVDPPPAKEGTNG